MNPDRLTIDKENDYYVVSLDKGADYLKEYSIREYGEKVAWQLAATYREGYLDSARVNEQMEQAVNTVYKMAMNPLMTDTTKQSFAEQIVNLLDIFIKKS